jgi:hypothetical protein
MAERSDRDEEILELCKRLVAACGGLGLVSQRKGLGAVYAAMPGGGMLSEVVKCQPDDKDALQWFWSWDVPFCPASDVEKAAAMIKHVVTLAHA